jgi:hypothetical protein
MLRHGDEKIWQEYFRKLHVGRLNVERGSANPFLQGRVDLRRNRKVGWGPTVQPQAPASAAAMRLRLTLQAVDAINPGWSDGRLSPTKGMLHG